MHEHSTNEVVTMGKTLTRIVNHRNIVTPSDRGCYQPIEHVSLCAQEFFGRPEEPLEPPLDPKVLQERARIDRETLKPGT